MKNLLFSLCSVLTLGLSIFGQVTVRRNDGTTYQRTRPNDTVNDNYTTKGNVNPYNGRRGTRPRDGGGASDEEIERVLVSLPGTGEYFLVPAIVRSDPQGTAYRINYAGTAIISLLDRGALKGLSDDSIQPLIYIPVVLRIAESRFRWAIKFEPDNYLYHLNLGTILYRQKRGDEALESIRKALQLNPSSRIASVYEERIMREKVTVKILDDPQN